ncbi:hypothetical protein BH10ACT1_BH10ACT1_28200 [soil metagenome]
MWGLLAVGVLVAATSMAGLGGATPSGAAVGDTFAFDGQVSGTGTFDGNQDCGGHLDVVQDSTLTLDAGGEATLRFAYCLSAFDAAVTLTPIYDGTFTLTNAAGSVSGGLTGTVAAASGQDGRFATLLDLEVTAGTGELAGATGALAFDGSASAAATNLIGALVGTLTIGELPPTTEPPATPTTAAPQAPADQPGSVPSPPPAAVAVAGSPSFTG